MKIKDWHVMDNGSVHSCFYGDLNDFEAEELEDYKEILYDEWNASDFSEILGNILEDRNHHGWTFLPNMILELLEETTSGDSIKDYFMKRFAERMETEKFK